MGPTARILAATAALLAATTPAAAFPIRQAMPDGSAATLEVDPALLPAFGLPAPAVSVSAPPDATPASAPVLTSSRAAAAPSPADAAMRGQAGGGLHALAATPSRSLDGAGRWYLYAGTGRKTYGLAVLEDRQDGLALDALGRERDGGARAGLAWRKGDVQTSLGYLRGKVASGVPGVGSRSDDRLGLTLSWRPH